MFFQFLDVTENVSLIITLSKSEMDYINQPSDCSFFFTPNNTLL